jgi:hypothetical protein
MASKKEPLIWQAYEYAHQEKSADWYWAVSIIATSMAITSILFGNVLFAVFLVLAFFMLMVYAKRKPHLIKIKLDDRGVTEGHIHYHYSTIESFWVEDRFGETKLILKLKKKTSPYIIIPIVDVSSDDVRDYIKKYTPEEEHAEPLAKKIMEYLGF